MLTSSPEALFFLEWTSQAVMGDIQLLQCPCLLNNCGIKGAILGHKVNDKSVISLSAHQRFSFQVRRRETVTILATSPAFFSPLLWQLLQRATCVLNM